MEQMLACTKAASEHGQIERLMNNFGILFFGIFHLNSLLFIFLGNTTTEEKALCTAIIKNGLIWTVTSNCIS